MRRVATNKGEVYRRSHDPLAPVLDPAATCLPLSSNITPKLQALPATLVIDQSPAQRYSPNWQKGGVNFLFAQPEG